MTSRQLYEGVLIELNKSNAPNILLEDFNYFVNRAINQYINKRYNIYDVNQQTTDDLRVLKATALLTPYKVDAYNSLSLANMATYAVDLPTDYLHLLNCIVIYNVKKTYKCYNAGDTWRAAATRLTADAYSQVLDNFWLKPTYKRPYYYIHNINTSAQLPTDPYREITDSRGEKHYVGTDFKTLVNHVQGEEGFTGGEPGENSTVTVNNQGTEVSNILTEVGSGVPNTIDIHSPSSGNTVKLSKVERVGQIRYGNHSTVRLEIRYGTDNSVFTLDQIQGMNGGKIYIDYIKAPQHIRLTQEEIDFTEDKSQMLEFPDYVCQEILNELVHIVMENISDQRLQTHPVVSQSIANPAQAQTSAESTSA